MKKIGKLVLLALLCLNSVVPVNAEEQPLTTIEPEVVETEDAAEISNEENLELQDDDSVESSDLEVEVTLEPTEIPLIVESNNQPLTQESEPETQEVVEENSATNSLDNGNSSTNAKQIVRSMNVEYADDGKSITFSCDIDDESCNSSLKEITGQYMKLYTEFGYYGRNVPVIVDNKICISLGSFDIDSNSSNDNLLFTNHLLRILVHGKNSYFITFDKGVITTDEYKQSPSANDVIVSKTTLNDAELAFELKCKEESNYDYCNAWLNDIGKEISFLEIDGGKTVKEQGFYLSTSIENNILKITNGNNDFASKFKDMWDNFGTKYSLQVNVDEYYYFLSHHVDFGNGQENPSDPSGSGHSYLPYGTELEFDYLKGVTISCPIQNDDQSECKHFFESINEINIIERSGPPKEIKLGGNLDEPKLDESNKLMYIFISSDCIQELGNLTLSENTKISLDLGNDYSYQISPTTERFFYPNAFEGCSIFEPDGNIYTITCDDENDIDLIKYMSNNSTIILQYGYGSIKLIDYLLTDNREIKFDITKQNYNFVKGEYDNVWITLYASSSLGGELDVNILKKITSSDNKFIVERDGTIPNPPELTVDYRENGDDPGLWIGCKITDEACSNFLDEIYSTTQNIIEDQIRGTTVLTLWPNGAPIYIPMKDDFEYGNPFEKVKGKGDETINLYVNKEWFTNHSGYINEKYSYTEIQLSVPNYLDVRQSIGKAIQIDLDLQECNQITGFVFDEEFNGIIKTNIEEKEEAIDLFKSILTVGSTYGNGNFTYSESNVKIDKESNYYYEIPVENLMFILASAEVKKEESVSIIFTFKKLYDERTITSVSVEGNPYAETPAHQIIAVADGFVIKSEDKDFLDALVKGMHETETLNSKIVISNVNQGPGEYYSLNLRAHKYIYNEYYETLGYGSVRVILDWEDIENLQYTDSINGTISKIRFDGEYYLIADVPYYHYFSRPDYRISFDPIKLRANIEDISSESSSDKLSLSLMQESDEITGRMENLIKVNNVVNGDEASKIATDDVTISGLLAAAISSDENGELDYSDYNEVRECALNVGISTSIGEVNNKNIEILEKYADNHYMTTKQLSFDISIDKCYGENCLLSINNDSISITELPMDVALSFELPDSSKNYKLLHNHNGVIEELDVIKDGDTGIAFTDKFSSFMLVEYTPTNDSITDSANSDTPTWDDGGPFTTDACGSVFDRWGNKIYDAGVCNVDSNNGYQLVNTSDK